MGLVVFLHLMFVGVWAGLVAVESVIELIGRQNETVERYAARMHFYTDIFFEIPIILGVLSTGIFLFDIDKMQGLYAVKITCGLAAIATNLLCTVFVFQRAKLPSTTDAKQLRMHTNRVAATILALPLAATAFFIGIKFLGINGL